MRAGVLAMHDYLLGIGAPSIKRQVTIFVYHNLDSLAAEFKAITGRALAEDTVGPEFVAGRSMVVSGGRWIARNKSSTDPAQTIPPGDLKSDLAGRLFRIFRSAASELPLHASDHQVPLAGPRWLSEGAFRYFTWQALRASGTESCDPTRGSYAHFRRSGGAPLSMGETSTGLYSLEEFGQFAFLAAELLAEQAGQGSLAAYYASLRPVTTWQEAFQTNFGTTVEEFYQLFEERRAAGFPQPHCPTLPPLVTMPGVPD